MNRRRTLMLAAAGGPLVAPLPVFAAAPARPTALPSAEAFAALVGQEITVAGQVCRLKAVRTVDSHNRRIEQFSLVLDGTAGLPSGLYALQHPALGTLHLQWTDSSEADEGADRLRADISRVV